MVRAVRKKQRHSKNLKKDISLDKFDFKQVLVKVAFFGMLLVVALLLSRMGVDKYDENRIGKAFFVSTLPNTQTDEYLTTQTTDIINSAEELTIRKYLRIARSNPESYIIVLGRNAGPSEVARAAELAGLLRISVTKFDNEINIYTVRNAILIGLPSTNIHIRDDFLGYDSKAEILQNNNLYIKGKLRVDEIINFLKTYETNPNSALDTKCLKGNNNYFVKCLNPVCGDLKLDAGEECDTNLTKKCTEFESLVAWPNPNGVVRCDRCQWNISICSMSVCGNGRVENGEACDDGNIMNNDSCSSNCTYTGICSDSDGGVDAFVAGTTIGRYGNSPSTPIQTFHDYCWDTGGAGIGVQDFICISNGYQTVTLSFSYCPPGFTCAAGACIVIGNNTNCTNECSIPGQRRCVNGLNYQTCANYDQDSCLEWSNISICGPGYSCVGPGQCQYNSTQINNTNSSCYDNDGGLNIDVASWAANYTNGVVKNNLTDSCLDSIYVNEARCTDNSVSYYGMKCPQSCLLGRCVNVSCGNGNLEVDEQCDDGNTRDDDGCSAKCQNESFFIFETTPYLDKAVIKLVNQTTINQARQILDGIETRKVHVTGTISNKIRSYNLGYHFNFEPETVTFFENSVEVCDASLNYIEDIYANNGTFLNGRWCPWGSRLLKETTPGQAICWNNYLESGEKCDGRKTLKCGNFDELGPWTNPNTAINCSDDCTPDLKPCVREAFCGNGVIDPGEECDSSTIGFECSDYGNFTGGDMICSSCKIKFDLCTKAINALIADVKNQIAVRNKYALLIGKTASASDSIAAVDVSGSTRIDTTIFDQTYVANPDRPNRIIIGGPCVNSEASRLLDIPMSMPECYEYFPAQKGQAIIKVVKDNGNDAIIIAGYDAVDTRRAGRVVIDRLDTLSYSYVLV